jgi:hypothetical protein
MKRKDSYPEKSFSSSKFLSKLLAWGGGELSAPFRI